jgi:hypothetical protein
MSVKETAEALGLVLSSLMLIGLAVRFVLFPWLEKRFAPLATQVRETHHQVTVNGHQSDEPTMLDKLDTLKAEVRELKGETRSDISHLRGDLANVGRLYDLHVDHSGDDRAELWDAVRELRAMIDGNPAATEGEDSEREPARRPAGPADQRPAGPDAS